jgi:lipopolysaccharide/colanic/teichoic acid biosynthesis glycosyltransferase
MAHEVQQRLALDLRYTVQAGVWLDLKIMFWTLRACSRQGATDVRHLWLLGS